MKIKKARLIRIVIFIVLLIPVNGFSVAIPDTGQTACYDTAGNVLDPCPSPGEPFYGQDVQYQPQHPRSYTKLGAGGVELANNAAHFDDGGPWLMTRDNVTGLVWETKSVSNKNDTYSWADATDVFISGLNSTNYGSHNDWRLPTIKELITLVNLDSSMPAIDTVWFPNTHHIGYWSSSVDAGYSGGVWFLRFDDGYAHRTIKSFDGGHVYAVRGETPEILADSIPPNRFHDNLDGTVTDLITGFMWQQYASNDEMIWRTALSTCEDLNLAGFSNWRLPNWNELKSLVDYSQRNPAIDAGVFPDAITSASCWSSTSLKYDASQAWVENFLYGDGGNISKSNSYYARAIRGGHSGSFDNLVFLSPKQASSWNIGFILPIRWETSGLGTNVKISLSRQGGKNGTFETIIASTPNDGQYDWSITGTGSVNCVIKIEQADNADNWATEGLFILSADDAEIFYFHEWGHNDATGENYTSIMKAAFDDFGKFAGQTIIHSEGETGTLTGSYTVLNGVLTVTPSSGPDLEFRISSDDEKLAGITARSPASGIYNEVLRIGVKESSLNSIVGTYYIFGWGHEDEGNFTVVYLNKVIFDGSGGYTSELIYDSEGDSGISIGSYTISNGLITLSDEEETLSVRVSPDGEILAGVIADTDNENLIVGMKEAPVSNIAGTFYFYNWGHEDDITNYTCTNMGKIIFDGAGGFTSETFKDSEDDDLGTRTGTYTIADGFINFSWEFEDDPPDVGKIRIAPDGKTFAGITTQVGNENLMFAVSGSEIKAMPWIPLLLLDQ